MSQYDETQQEETQRPRGDEPGATSTPRDDGAGVAGVEDRTGDGAPAANQGKSEPFPPGPAAPDLASMNVGAGDPQAPSHQGAGPAADRAGAGLPVEPAPTAPSPGAPASRVPGHLGRTGADEQIETDVEASASTVRPGGSGDAGPGNSAGVPVGSTDPAPGSSQESGEVQGARTPE